MKRVRYKRGSVVYDQRRKVWNFLYCLDHSRHTIRIGSKAEYPTKASAWAAAEALRQSAKAPNLLGNAITVKTLVEQYRAERMPERHSTRLAYEAWFNNHIIPRWGESLIISLQARDVGLWLRPLPLSPKSKAHIRGLLHALLDYAMWRGHVTAQRNVMELVSIRGATKRTRQPRSLTVEEFQKFVRHLDEPFNVIALVSVCFGLRISETLGLRWADIDRTNNSLRIERGIVRQVVASTKTDCSQQTMSIDAAMLNVLNSWRQTSQFSADSDWMFASPVKLGRLPWSYPWVWRVFQRAAEAAGVGKLGTHTMRHSYRSWLDAVGTSLAVQQKLMRHSDIRTTMNIYGHVITDEMAKAASKVAGLALASIN